MHAPLPPNEAERLAALRALRLLDTPAEPAFDELVQLAARVCGAPIALFSLVDEARQWFKARVGLASPYLPREHAFCAYTLLGEGPFIVPDAAQDGRLRHSPLVRAAPHVRFYAGFPVRSPAGHALGSLCVLDLRARTLSPLQLDVLQGLARQAERLLALRAQLSEQDVTRALEQAWGMEALRASEQRFAAVAECAGDAMVSMDAHGALLSWSAGAQRLFGLEESRVLGSPLTRVLAPADAPALQAELARAARGTPGCGPVQLHGLRADGGEFPLELVLGTWVTEQGRRYFSAALRDVSERQRLEGQLRAAERMASLGQLAAGVAHELNNPLAFVLGNLGYLQEQLRRQGHALSAPVREEWQAALSETVQGAERMRRIAHDLRLFARAEQPGGGLEGTEPLRDVDLSQALDFAMRVARHHLEPRGRLVRELQPVPPVRAPEGRLEQVLLNLLVNAAQALPVGAPQQHHVRVATHTDAAGHAVVEVQDTGSGIPPEHLPRLFEPFFTTKPAGEGTGLGLSICHGIVKAVGGELSVQSELGKGTTFRLVLPGVK